MPSKGYASSGSSSGSCSDESDVDEMGDGPQVPDNGKPLALLDDTSCLIAPPPERGDDEESLGEVEDTVGEDGLPSEELGTSNGASRADEASSDKSKKKKKKKRKILYINTTNCKYDVIRRMSRKFGFKEVPEDEDWNLFWTDYSVALERVMEMKRYQKINHFPGMSEICRKDLLARNLNRMSKQFPKDYNVFPKSWVLPADHGDFQAYTRQKKNKSYISKPPSGCQGKGIWVTKNPKDIKPHEHAVVQQYISRPFLIDGFKFDFRIYVVVTSCDPFRIFVFKDGLARFATVKYREPTHNNQDNVFMHLTNYAINKTSENFVRDDEEGGSKRRITTINRWWKENGYDLDKIWADIDDVIIKTFISINEVLTHNYRTCFPNHVGSSACFEVLGFDVMFDKKLKPFVVEINHSPSFHTDAQLDKEIKEALIYDTLNIINCGAVDKRKCIEEERKKIKERLFQRGPSKKETKEELEQQQAVHLKALEKYEDEHLGNMRRIYPGKGTERYDKFFHSSGSLFQETAAYKARSEAARVQREEIRQKQEKIDAMKMRKSSSVRPESPSVVKKRIRRPALPTRKLSFSNSPARQVATSTLPVELPVAPPMTQAFEGNSMTAMEILEEEEMERINGLLQRDNLVRGLGIVEHVYRMLHSTMGAMTLAARPYHRPSLPLQMLSQFNHRVNSLGKLREGDSADSKPMAADPPARQLDFGVSGDLITLSAASKKPPDIIMSVDGSTIASPVKEAEEKGSSDPLAEMSKQLSGGGLKNPLSAATGSQWQRKNNNINEQWQRKQIVTRKNDSDRKVTLHTATESHHHHPQFRTYSASNGRRSLNALPNFVYETQPNGGGSSSLGPYTQYSAALSGRVQPLLTQHLSVVSAPAPVIQRPDHSHHTAAGGARKLTSLEAAIKSRSKKGQPVKLKQLEMGHDNTIVLS